MSVHYYSIRLDLDGPRVRADVFALSSFSQIGAKTSAIVIASSPSEAIVTAVSHITSHCLMEHGPVAIPVPLIERQETEALYRLTEGPDHKIGHRR
jgi:hypothetical protein